MCTYQGKNILVLGTGISGQGVAKVLANRGANVVVNDKKDLAKDDLIRLELEKAGAKVITGYQDDTLLENIDFIVVSPGIPTFIPLLQSAKKLNIPVVSEVDIAYGVCQAPILGITGTNGKTTTTMLVGNLIKACKKESVIGGNIGTSLSEQALTVSKDGYLVAELSSYQLETIHDFHAKGAIFLNLTPDHLHRHKTMKAYGEAKMNILKNQNEDDIAVLNMDDEYVKSCAKDCKGKVVWISKSKHEMTDGAYYDNGMIYAVKDGVICEVIRRAEINLRGDHNVENVLAAVALLTQLGFDSADLANGIRNFNAVEHRIEPVCTKDGILYINDSKGTNTDATIKALSSFAEPLILLLGGHDKGEDLHEFMKIVKDRAKFIVFMGEASARFIEVAKEVAISEDMYAKADSMQAAVDIATAKANEGDIVLLSPACSSFDWYNSFEERGNDFKTIVKK